MKTTGVSPEALAASISRFSRSEVLAVPNSLPVDESQTDPIGVIGGGRAASAVGPRYGCGLGSSVRTVAPGARPLTAA
jgi:hypothetical protein